MRSPKLLTVVLISAALLPIMAANAADEVQCAAAWRQADANGDGQLQPEEAANLATTGSADDAAALMTESEFMDACLKGMFDSIFQQQ